MEKAMRKMYLVVLAGVLVMTVVGCGTVKGFGDDISTVGNWFMRGSDRAR